MFIENNFKFFSSLSNAVFGNDSNKKIISVTGAGGKTTVVKQLAREYCAFGKKTLVVTTTHMFREKENCVLSGNIKDIVNMLNTKKLCFAGMPEGEKISALNDDVLSAAMNAADIVIGECDGSRQLPVKYPNSTEPVILPHTTDILVVMGLSAIGKKVNEVMHRFKLAGYSGTETVDTAVIKRLIDEGYKKPLGKKYSNIHCILNQADTPYLISCAREIDPSAIITSFKNGG